MKCAYYQNKKKSKLSAESKKRLSHIINDFMEKSLVIGPEKALEIMKAEQANQEDVEEELK